MKRCVTLILTLALLIGTVGAFPLFTSAETAPGSIYAPDYNNWGTQDNNGWYYMYRDLTGIYHEMTHYDDSATINWQKNNYASDPVTMLEMFFIDRVHFFMGELGSQPTYAFKAPSGGQIQLTFQTHGSPQMSLSLYKNDSLVQINGADKLNFTTSGTLEGAMTETTVTIDVKKNTMLYMVTSTSDMSIRDGWFQKYSVKYITVNDSVEEPLPNDTPDFDSWGIQNNNNWYYMFRDGSGAYHELDHYETSDISWQVDNFASDPAAIGEMLFISKTSFFIGENGSKPVYAYKAPVGGDATLSFMTHGSGEIHLQLYMNNEPVNIGDSDSIAFTTTGAAEGFTLHSVQLALKKNTMLYLVASTEGTNREGWLKNYSVKYSATNDLVEGELPSYSPNMDNWGMQGNNNWYYMYKNANTGLYSEMSYFDSSSTIDWQKDSYASDPYTMNEMFFINKSIFFTGENGTRPVYAFKAPVGGEIRLTVNTHGVAALRMEIFKNSELIKINDSDYIQFTTTGSLPGAFTENSVTLSVKKNTWVYLVGYTVGTDRGGYVNRYSVEYLSTNNEVEEDVPVVTEKVEGAASVWNETLDYVTLLHNKVADKSTPLTWLFVGDSITANDGDFSLGYRNYSEIIESYLTTELDRPNDRVVNTAVSGWKIGNINYTRDIAAYSPDIVYVKIGTNDTFASDIAATNFKAAMKILYNKIIASGAIPVLAIANGFSSKWVNTTQTDNFALRYPTVMRELALELDLPIVDYYSVYDADKERSANNWFCLDNIHPNNQGLLVHAQTFINDLGLDVADAPILTQDPDTAALGERMPDMVFFNAEPSSFISDGTATTLAEAATLASSGFCLLGGQDAVGYSNTLITRRSIAQLLDNNNQLGRQESYFGSIDALSTLIPTLAENGKQLFLYMPQAYAADGTSLSSADDLTTISQTVSDSVEAGYKLVLITPAPCFSDTLKNDAASELTTILKNVGAANGVPVIDLNGYLTAIASQVSRVESEWFDANGVLNYAGCVDAAELIADALGKDSAAFSSRAFNEDISDSVWGAQGINNWYYMYQDKATEAYSQLAFIPAAEAGESWVADRFADSNPYRFLFIGKQVFHCATDANIAKVFDAPYSGSVTLRIQLKRSANDVSQGGNTGSMHLRVYKNDQLLRINDDETSVVALAGGYQIYNIDLDIEAGDKIRFVAECEYASEGYLIPSVVYRSLSSQLVGDMDGDGEITVADALHVLRIAARLITCPEELKATADTDGDGSITVADALHVLRIAARLIEA